MQLRCKGQLYLPEWCRYLLIQCSHMPDRGIDELYWWRCGTDESGVLERFVIDEEHHARPAFLTSAGVRDTVEVSRGCRVFLAEVFGDDLGWDVLDVLTTIQDDGLADVLGKRFQEKQFVPVPVLVGLVEARNGREVRKVEDQEFFRSRPVRDRPLLRAACRERLGPRSAAIECRVEL